MAFVTEILTYAWEGVRAVVAGTPRTAASVNAGLSDLASRTKWLKFILDKIAGSEVLIEAVNTTTNRLTITNHPFSDNDPVQFMMGTGGLLPGGISLNTVYFVGVVDADTITVSATSGPGAAVDLTSGFSSQVWLIYVPDLMTTLLMSSTTYGSGALAALVMFLGGTQSVTGAKTFADITVSSTNKYKVASRGVSRFYKGVWYEDGGNTVRAGGITIPDDAIAYGYSVNLPNSSTLTEIVVYVDPADHTGTGLPAGMPKFQFVKFNVGTNSSSNVGSEIVDTSANATIYSARHTITGSGYSEVIDNGTYTYFLVVYGETGGNKAPLPMGAVKFTCTVTSQDDGAS